MKYLIVICAIIAVDSYVKADENDSRFEVKVIKNITEFRNANPSLKIVEMKSSKAVTPRLSQIIYTLGTRYSGDRLVGADSGWNAYPNKQNIELRVWYPTSGVGAIVNFVQVIVSQDTGTSGRGYVVYGGIGQRNIQVLIEAWNTAYIDYRYSIYGL
jgi:hypothetical protein